MFVNMIYTWLPFTCLVWVAATASTSLQPSSPPPIYDLLSYFARDFYKHKYSCSPQERECMKRGKLLYETDGECYSVGERGPCAEGRTFHAELQEAMRLGGHLRGTCESVCEDDSQAPFVTTGECLTRSQVESQFCRSEWYLSPVKDAFGQWVCEWTELPCNPESPPQRFEWMGERYTDPYNGLCYPPYIFLRVGGNNSTILGFLVPCSEEEFGCLRENRVLVDGACHALRTQGLCAEGQELLLDRDALRHGRLQAVCKTRPCPVGSVLLPYNGRCFTHEKVSSLLCEGEPLILDDFGEWQCSSSSGGPADLAKMVRHANSTCELPPQT